MSKEWHAFNILANTETLRTNLLQIAWLWVLLGFPLSHYHSLTTSARLLFWHQTYRKKVINTEIAVYKKECYKLKAPVYFADEGINRHRFNKLQSNVVFFHLNGSPTLYVGGTDMVCSIDFDANKYMEVSNVIFKPPRYWYMPYLHIPGGTSEWWMHLCTR